MNRQCEAKRQAETINYSFASSLAGRPTHSSACLYHGPQAQFLIIGLKLVIRTAARMARVARIHGTIRNGLILFDWGLYRVLVVAPSLVMLKRGRFNGIAFVGSEFRDSRLIEWSAYRRRVDSRPHSSNHTNRLPVVAHLMKLTGSPRQPG